MSFINRKQKMRKMPEPVQTGTTPSDRQPATETVPNEPEAPVIHQRKSRRAVNRQSATPADIANSVRESLLKRKLLGSMMKTDKAHSVSLIIIQRKIQTHLHSLRILHLLLNCQ